MRVKNLKNLTPYFIVLLSHVSLSRCKKSETVFSFSTWPPQVPTTTFSALPGYTGWPSLPSSFPDSANLCYINSTGDIIPDAPCNVASEEAASCLGTIDCGRYEPSGCADERDCICRNDAFWQNANGCDNCLRLHGVSYKDDHETPELLSSFSLTYCSLPVSSVTADYYIHYLFWVQSVTEASNFPTTLSGYGTDVLGSKTAVSYYFTSGVSTPTGSSGVASSGPSATGNSASASASVSPTGEASGRSQNPIYWSLLATAILTFVLWSL